MSEANSPAPPVLCLRILGGGMGEVPSPIACFCALFLKRATKRNMEPSLLGDLFDANFFKVCPPEAKIEEFCEAKPPFTPFWAGEVSNGLL